MSSINPRNEKKLSQSTNAIFYVISYTNNNQLDYLKSANQFRITTTKSQQNIFKTDHKILQFIILTHKSRQTIDRGICKTVPKICQLVRLRFNLVSAVIRQFTNLEILRTGQPILQRKHLYEVYSVSGCGCPMMHF